MITPDSFVERTRQAMEKLEIAELLTGRPRYCALGANCHANGWDGWQLISFSAELFNESEVWAWGVVEGFDDRKYAYYPRYTGELEKAVYQNGHACGVAARQAFILPKEDDCPVPIVVYGGA